MTMNAKIRTYRIRKKGQGFRKREWMLFQTTQDLGGDQGYLFTSSGQVHQTHSERLKQKRGKIK